MQCSASPVSMWPVVGGDGDHLQCAARRRRIMRLIFVPAWRSAWPAAWRPGSAWRKAPVPVCEAARDTRHRDTGAGDTARDVDVDVLNTWIKQGKDKVGRYFMSTFYILV